MAIYIDGANVPLTVRLPADALSHGHPMPLPIHNTGSFKITITGAIGGDVILGRDEIAEFDPEPAGWKHLRTIYAPAPRSQDER